MADMTKSLHVSVIMDFGLHVTELVLDVVDINFLFKDVFVASCDQLQGLLVMSQIHLILESEYDWLNEILMFEWMKRRWLIFQICCIDLD